MAAAGGYAACVVYAWTRYGRPAPPRSAERDDLLDRFIPTYDVVERHRTRVQAAAEVTLAAACEIPLTSLPVPRLIFRAREVLLRAAPPTEPPRGIVAEVLALGWGVLAEVPGREIVIGAVTKPWEANPVFRALPPDTFATFDEPDYVKIAWTLRADPAAEDPEDRSIFRTETRAVATDAGARTKFRIYWSLLWPGIWLIRRMTLGPIRREAARRAMGSGRESPPFPRDSRPDPIDPQRSGNAGGVGRRDQA